MADANYEMGYLEGYDSIWSVPIPAPASWFASVDEWDLYLDGYYTGRSDAALSEYYALRDEENDND